MKRGLAAAVLGLGALCATAIGAFQMSPALQDAVFRRGAHAQLVRQGQLSLDRSALRVVLCGTSSPLPLRRSAKSCAAVVAGGRLFIVDIGPEASENLALWRVPTPKISAVFLTHFHSDHMGELGELNTQSWAQGRRVPLPVYGPIGVDQVVAGFNTAYAFDRSYRHAHHDHGKGLLPLAAAALEARPIAVAKPGEAPQGRRQVVYDEGGVVITAIEADHRPVTPALAYRFDYGGRSVVISGDTIYYPPLAAAAKGADVLISEAQSHHMQDLFAEEADTVGQSTLASVLRDTSAYHINPVQAARLANEAGVAELVYTHIAPPIIIPILKTPWLRGVSEVRRKGVRIGQDGMLITLPIADRSIRFSKLKG